MLTTCHVSAHSELDADYPVYQDPLGAVAPKEARDYGEAALRDQEYMKQLPISGYQFISGTVFNIYYSSNQIHVQCINEKGTSCNFESSFELRVFCNIE